MDKYQKLKEILESSNNIVFFGGAGVSTESKIPDFRSEDGIYNQKWNYKPEEILSRSFFLKNTLYFYKFYKEKMIYLDAKPNYAHLYLANLEKEGKLKAIITQNIDSLHQKAGSINVLELHGSIYDNTCMKCKNKYDISEILKGDIPYCKCGGIIKPNVVLYEEQLDEKVITKSINYIENAETLIVAGTSLTVYPAASFVKFFKGKNLILMNKSKTFLDDMATLVFNEQVGSLFQKIDLNIYKFLNEENKIKVWPSKHEDKKNVVKFLSYKFETNREYSEKEVNEILKNSHLFNDHILLRRSLIDYGFLKRTNDGMKYWR